MFSVAPAQWSETFLCDHRHVVSDRSLDREEHHKAHLHSLASDIKEPCESDLKAGKCSHKQEPIAGLISLAKNFRFMSFYLNQLQYILERIRPPFEQPAYDDLVTSRHLTPDHQRKLPSYNPAHPTIGRD
jgi:hypothetical protein